MLFLDNSPDQYTHLEFHLTEHQKIEDYGVSRLPKNSDVNRSELFIY